MCTISKRIRISINSTTQQVKHNYQNRLKLGAKKNNIIVNKAYFKNKEDDNPCDYSEEQVAGAV